MKRVFSLVVIICTALLSFAQLPNWTVNPADFQYTANLTGVLYINDTAITSNGNKLCAIVDGQVRGVAGSTNVGGQKMFFLTIYSNLSSGEEVLFQAYIANADSVYNIEDTVMFVSSAIFGTPASPHILPLSPTPVVFLNNETDFLSFSMSEQTSPAVIDVLNHTVNIEVNNGTDITSLVASFSLSPGASAIANSVLQVSDVSQNDFTNPVVYIVTAEDGITNQFWVVTVSEAPLPSNDTKFLSFSFLEQTDLADIDTINHTIDIELLMGTSPANIVAYFTLSDGATAFVSATEQITGITPNDFSIPVIYNVIAEDGITSQNWTVNVTVATTLFNKADFLAFSIPEQTGPAIIDTLTNTINIELLSGTSLTNLVASFTLSGGATVTIGSTPQVSGVTENDFSSTLYYDVTAQNLINFKQWTVIATLASVLNSENDILTFTLPSQTGPAIIDNVNNTVDIEVDYGTNLASLIASFTLSSGAYANVAGVLQVSGTTVNDFTNPIIYVVTAEDGINIQNWIVNVSEAPLLNDETDFLTFSLPDQTGPAIIDDVNHSVSIEVDLGTDLTSLVASFTLSTGAYATIGSIPQVSNLTVNDFTNPVVYLITAENGVDAQEWIVNVTIEPLPNNQTDILAFSLPEQTNPALIDTINHIVNIEVGYGTNPSALIATFTLSEGATAEVSSVLQISATTANDFSNPVIYVVTAEDAINTQNWIVVVSVSTVLNDQTDILTYSLPQQTSDAVINPVSHTIDIEVETGTDLTALVASFTLSYGASAKVDGDTQVSDTTANDFSSLLVYTVTAENGINTQSWIINVSEQIIYSNMSEIISFLIFNQVDSTQIDTINNVIIVPIDSTVNKSALVPFFSLSPGAVAKVSGEVQVSGISQNDFTFPVVYMVIAENGIDFTNWIVIVEDNTSVEYYSEESNILVYPNPASSFLNIDIKQSYQKILVSLFDSKGQVVFYDDLSKNFCLNNRINLENLTAGVYYLIINADGKKVTKKISVN